MSDTVILGTTLGFGLGAAALFVYFGWRSWQRRRAEPMLVLALAMVPLFWLEAPGDWAFWAQYHPSFAHVPNWGPLGMTYGGLPLIAIPAYPAYWVPPIFIAIWVAKRRYWSARFSTTNRLLVSGLVVGFVWDVPFEIFATRVGIWRMAYAPWGLTLFGGTKYQVPLNISIAVALLCMFSTFLIGRTDDRGEVALLGWARRHTKSSGGAHLLNYVMIVAALQIVYVFTFLPVTVVHLFGYVTHESSEPLYGDIPLQRTPGMGNGVLGFAILIGGAALQVWLISLILNRLDARLVGRTSRIPVNSSHG